MACGSRTRGRSLELVGTGEQASSDTALGECRIGGSRLRSGGADHLQAAAADLPSCTASPASRLLPTHDRSKISSVGSGNSTDVTVA